VTLDQMKILVAIFDTGSVLSAAKKLHRTQPTISVGLKKLEDELGVQLLDRSSYRAMLTSEGRQLCEKSRVILQQVDEFKTMAKYLSLGHEPKVHLAIEASCPMDVLLDILKASEAKYPQTDFHLRVENIWGALDKVQDGDVDLAISPWLHDQNGLESLPLTTTRLLTVAAPGFCPADCPLEIDQMKHLVQIVVSDSGWRDHAMSYGVLDGGRHWIVSDHQTKKELIVAGMGWGKLQEHIVKKELLDGVLVPLEIVGYPYDVSLDIRAIRRFGEPTGPVAQALWNDLSEVCQKQNI